jgi:hypothetical protein
MIYDIIKKIDINKYYCIRKEIKEFLYNINCVIICMDNVI